MTIQETIKIMAMLSAYYGQGKSDAKIMAQAWHLILKDYPYNVAEAAVIKFAKEDNRDYGTFPTPGAIVKSIEAGEAEQKNLINRTFSAMLNEVPYGEMPEEQRAICDQKLYERGLNMDEEELLARQDDFKAEMRKEQKRLHD